LFDSYNDEKLKQQQLYSPL